MFDPISISALGVAIVTAILQGIPLLRSLWRRLKAKFGSSCRTVSYLQGMNRNSLENSVQTVLRENPKLLEESQRHYGASLSGGAGQSMAVSNRSLRGGEGRGYGSGGGGGGGGWGGGYLGDFSDFSDFGD